MGERGRKPTSEVGFLNGKRCRVNGGEKARDINKKE
jgi:hypothetical protein